MDHIDNTPAPEEPTRFSDLDPGDTFVLDPSDVRDLDAVLMKNDEDGYIWLADGEHHGPLCVDSVSVVYPVDVVYGFRSKDFR